MDARDCACEYAFRCHSGEPFACSSRHAPSFEGPGWAIIPHFDRVVVAGRITDDDGTDNVASLRDDLRPVRSDQIC